MNLNLDIKPITILIGPNGSGKSSVLQALAALKQTISLGQEHIGIRPAGEIINLGTYSDISHQHNDAGTIGLVLLGTFAVSQEVAEFCGSSLGNIAYALLSGKNSVVECSLDIVIGDVVARFQVKDRQTAECSVVKGNKKLEPATYGMRGVVPHIDLRNPIEVTVLDEVFGDGKALRNLINSFHLVPAARGIDLYGVPLRQAATDQFATSLGPVEQATRLITKLHYDRNLVDEVSKWTQRLIGKTIRQRPVEFPPLGLRHADDKNVYGSIEFIKDNVKSVLVNEGYGINQLILLLTQLALAKEGDLLGVEEPEVHLHPKAQSVLAKMLIEEVKKRKISVIFTTHSEHILYPFLVDIARGSLAKDHVAIYYFEYDDNSKATKVTPLKIDEKGMIEGGLRGFFEQDMALLNDYVKALTNE